MRLIFIFVFTLITFSATAGDMNVINMDGLFKEIKSHNAKTMVVFWAPWCPYCMRELKTIRDNPEFVSSNNLQVIGLSKKADRNRSIAFIKNEEMPFKFFTAEQEIYDKLQRIDAVPLTLVYNNKGELLDFEYGKQTIEDLALMLED